MEIKKRLPIFLFMLSLFPVLALSFFTLLMVQNAQYKTSLSYMNDMAKVFSEQVRVIIKSGAQFFMSFDDGSGNKGEIESFFYNHNFPGDCKGLTFVDLGGEIKQHYGTEPPQTSFATEPYFIKAIKGEIGVSSIISNQGSNFFYIANPLFSKEQKLIGALLRMYDLDAVQFLTNTLQFDNGGYAYLVDINGKIIAHPDQSRIGTFTENQALKDILTDTREGRSVVDESHEYNYRGSDKVMNFKQIEGLPWGIVVAEDRASLFNKSQLLVIWLALFIVLVASADIFGIVRFYQRILTPVALYTKIIKDIGLSNFQVSSFLERHDEIGRLGEAINSSIRHLDETNKATKLDIQIKNERLLLLEGVFEQSNICIFEWNMNDDGLTLSHNAVDIFGPDCLRIKTLEELMQSYFSSEHRISIKEAIKAHKDGLNANVRVSAQVLRVSAHQPVILIKARRQHEEPIGSFIMSGIIIDLSTSIV